MPNQAPGRVPASLKRKHTVFIYDRGGIVPIYELKRVSKISYNRVRDDMSTATVEIQSKDARGQLKQLGGIEPGRHELVIFRENKLAWMGPVNIPESQHGSWTITANDICFYLDRTAMRAAYSNANTAADYVVNRMKKIITAELARKEAIGYNLLGHMHYFVQDGDARTSAVTSAYAMSVWDHLDENAARNGIDYTVVGRELYIWDTSRPAVGQTPTVTRKDFVTEPSTKKYGSELATRVIATDGQGGFGTAGTSGSDPYYGEVEVIVQAYDEETDAALPTQAELTSQAKLYYAGRNPTPMLLTVPSGATLSPDSVLTFDMLVPGAYVPLALERGGKTITRMQKLQDVSISEDDNGETIGISLYAASGYTGEDVV